MVEEIPRIKHNGSLQTKSTQSTQASSRYSSGSDILDSRLSHKSLADNISPASSLHLSQDMEKCSLHLDSIQNIQELSSDSRDSSKINLVHVTDIDYFLNSGSQLDDQTYQKKFTRSQYEQFLNADNPDRYYVGSNDQSSNSLRCIDEDTELYQYNYGIEDNETNINFVPSGLRSMATRSTRNSDIFDGVYTVN